MKYKLFDGSKYGKMYQYINQAIYLYLLIDQLSLVFYEVDAQDQINPTIEKMHFAKIFIKFLFNMWSRVCLQCLDSLMPVLTRKFVLHSLFSLLQSEILLKISAKRSHSLMQHAHLSNIIKRSYRELKSICL